LTEFIADKLKKVANNSYDYFATAQGIANYEKFLAGVGLQLLNS